MADEICPALTALLTDPPSGFVALRGEKTSETWAKWKAKPLLPNAQCEVSGDTSDPQQELTCIVNDRADAASATVWYKAAAAQIDACLPRLPNGARYVRKGEVANNADAFEGVATSWVFDGGGEKVEIELTNESNFGRARNTITVRYLKR